MKKYILGSIVVAGALLVGCGSDGGECCGANSGVLAGLGAKSLPPQGPAALFDGNWTIEKNIAKSNGFNSSKELNTDRETQSSNALKEDNEAVNFVFNCADSYNQDDANISIKDCVWNFSATQANCIDKNTSVGQIVNLKYSCNNAILDGNLTVGLSVTDELNQTADSSAILKIKKDIAKVATITVQ